MYDFLNTYIYCSLEKQALRVGRNPEDNSSVTVSCDRKILQTFLQPNCRQLQLSEGDIIVTAPIPTKTVFRFSSQSPPPDAVRVIKKRLGNWKLNL